MIDWKQEWKPLTILLAVFIGFLYVPVGIERFNNAVMEALHLAQWYAREHVILCLAPAFFIAGAIVVFLSQASVMKYLSAAAGKVVAYGTASVSGVILAVCSCTVLPLFAGIYRMGAGLGPATTFLYSGPAINILAIILTAKVLGLELGIARAVGAVVFSIVIGLLMHVFFQKEEEARVTPSNAMTAPEVSRPLLRNALYFAAMIGILVFANWGKPEGTGGIWNVIYSYKWTITGLLALALAVFLASWFKLRWWHVALAGLPSAILVMAMPGDPVIPFVAGLLGLSILTSTDKNESGEWFSATWGFTKQIMPLLFFGVLFAGALLGRPNHEGLIPTEWVNDALGGNSLMANFFASFASAFMYFATLTEVPILQGLMGNGMGKGPALALLLAGPALSLPNMLVIRSVLGTKKTMVFVALVIVMATFSGMIYGTIFG